MGITSPIVGTADSWEGPIVEFAFLDSDEGVDQSLLDLLRYEDAEYVHTRLHEVSGGLQPMTVARIANNVAAAYIVRGRLNAAFEAFRVAIGNFGQVGSGYNSLTGTSHVQPGMPHDDYEVLEGLAVANYNGALAMRLAGDRGTNFENSRHLSRVATNALTEAEQAADWRRPAHDFVRSALSALEAS